MTMKIIDISRELISASVYPGDPAPHREILRRMEQGDMCNLSERFYGPCTVVDAVGLITGADIDRIIGSCQKKILFRGNGEAFLTQSAAFALSEAGVELVGTDAQSVAAAGDETAPHVGLLGAGIIALEGLDLTNAEPGEYILCAFPVYLAGAEASLTRAVLLKEE